MSLFSRHKKGSMIMVQVTEEGYASGAKMNSNTKIVIDQKKRSYTINGHDIEDVDIKELSIKFNRPGLPPTVTLSLMADVTVIPYDESDLKKLGDDNSH